MKTRRSSRVQNLETQINNNADDDYDKLLKNFSDNVESIYDGSFFERVPVEDNLKLIKKHFKYGDLKRLNTQLNTLKNNYKNACPSIISILNLNIANSKKQELLEKIHLFTNSEMLSFEYNNYLKLLNQSIENKDNSDELVKLEDELNKLCNSYESNTQLKLKILQSNMSMQNKVIAFNKFKILNSYNNDSDSEYFKYKIWIDSLLQIPFGIYKTPNIDMNNNERIRDYLKNIRLKLDEKLSFLEKPKDQFLNMISHNIRNPNANFNAIGLHGVRGTGKTSLISSLSEAIGRPFRIISLGGQSDASMLTGHNFTYVGSTPGRIIDILKETQCMNGIILFDELDKISDTAHGQEIIGALIHLTDTTTNKKYAYDKYFSGVEFDLSKIMFVFTYNDSTKINKILADRLYKIEISNYTDNEKFTIVKDHLILTVLKEYYFTLNDIIFSDEVIKYIIKLSNQNGGEDGMRDIKNKLQTIISRINILLLTNKSDNIVKLNYNVLYEKFTSLPIQITNKDVDILLKQSDSNESSINDKVPFGMYM